jgi:Ca2+:H+ antiporter
MAFYWVVLSTICKTFNKLNAFIQSSLLFIVCIALMIPCSCSKKCPEESTTGSLQNISPWHSHIIDAYLPLSLVFSLKTHVNFFKSEEQEKTAEAEHVWPLKTALIVLAISATCIAIVSEIFVEGVQEVAIKLGLSQAFVGFIIIPIVGAAAEMMAAFTAARKNKLDISVSIAMGSSAQIALFVTPLMVLLSYFIRAGAYEP